MGKSKRTRIRWENVDKSQADIQLALEALQQAKAVKAARTLGCNEQTVRNAIHAFNRAGPAALTRAASRPPHHAGRFHSRDGREVARPLAPQPAQFGHDTSLWKLELAAAEAGKQGLTPHQLKGETIRATLARRGVRWLRAKQRITSPDPEYTRIKGGATA